MMNDEHGTMNDGYVRGRLKDAEVKLTCGDVARVTGTCEVLARQWDGLRVVGYIVAGYKREDGKRYIGDVKPGDVEIITDGNRGDDAAG